MVDIPGLRKKMSPEELRTKLTLSSKKLEKREAQMKEKAQRSKEEARDALKKGDERGFRVASKRFAMTQGQTNAISGMVEMTQGMQDVVEMQEGLKEVSAIGADLQKYQQTMGIDTQQMESAVTNIRMSMEKVNTATEMISSTMEAVTSGDVQVTAAQEELKRELMAEISAEGTEEEELEEKIRKAEEA